MTACHGHFAMSLPYIYFFLMQIKTNQIEKELKEEHFLFFFSPERNSYLGKG